MRATVTVKAFLAATVVLLAAPVQAVEVTGLPTLKLAAVSQAGGADWQQWDAFLTFVVKRFGRDFGGEIRSGLIDVFLDARYELVQALTPARSGRDPVPGLFVSTMKRLSPLLRQGVAGLPRGVATQYSSFIKAVDGLTALGEIGLQLGFARLSPDALRGLARIMEPTGAQDPVAYGVEIDSALRTLLGFGAPLRPPRPSSAVEQSGLPRAPLTIGRSLVPSLGSWLVETASAAESDAAKLNQWVPEREDLNAYLSEVRNLLKELSVGTLRTAKLADEFRPLYQNLIFATAWQESCWRQFIRKGQKLAPLRSATGDVGLMQVNQHVWRGVYDIKGLLGDIEYNGRAGAEILFYYLTRHAINRGEHKQPGGVTNLARATYAAYNGGPRHLIRYRAKKPIPSLKKVDDLFWQKYAAVSAGRELEVLHCYVQ